MTATASPWDALLRNRRPIRLCCGDAAVAVDEARPGSKLAALLAALQELGSPSTLALALQADLTPRQVWGLLKAPRTDGRVRFAAGRWELVPDYPGADVARAAALLRAKGWRVMPPNAVPIGPGNGECHDGSG